MAKTSLVMETFLGVSSGSPEGRVLRLLVEMGAQFVGAQEGSLLVADKNGRELVFAMTIGSESSERTLVGQRVQVGKGIVGLAAQTREVQIGAPTFGVRQREAPRWILAAPMLVGDRLAGVITAVTFEKGRRFERSHADLYGRVAAVAGVVVDQHRRLAAVEALREGRRPPAARGATERLDREIVETVVRLIRAKPGAKAAVAHLLAALESLIE
jgi:GAF domain-containing protein